MASDPAVGFHNAVDFVRTAIRYRDEHDKRWNADRGIEEECKAAGHPFASCPAHGLEDAARAFEIVAARLAAADAVVEAARLMLRGDYYGDGEDKALEAALAAYDKARGTR